MSKKLFNSTSAQDDAAAGRRSSPDGNNCQATAADGRSDDCLSSDQASHVPGTSSSATGSSSSAHQKNSIWNLKKKFKNRSKPTPTPDDEGAGANSPAAAAELWPDDRLSSVQASNLHMFDSQDSCDVQFVVKGPGDVDETLLGAHRYVLCSRSPYFHRLLWTAKAGAENKLKENDIPAQAFREVIRFMYCEDACLTPSNAIYVLRGARKFGVTPLSVRCLQFVEGSITDDDVCTILDKCLLFHEDELAQNCLQHIKHNTLAVLQTPGFLEIRVETLKRIVASENLNIPELELFNACIGWASARLHSQGQNSPTGSDLRGVLDPVIPLIRFPTMTTTDFATFVVPLNVLDETEICNVFMYFTCPEKPAALFQTTKRGLLPASSDSA